MLTASYDPVSGIIRTLSTGATDPAGQRVYVQQFQALTKQARAEKGLALHLVDATDAVIQTSFAMERFAAHRDTRERTVDKTAVIVKKSNLTVNSSEAIGEIRFFTDRDEAMSWLKA